MAEEPYPAMDRVINSEVIHQHFGYWPDFHDAEIVKVIFETHLTGRYSILFVIDAFEMTNEVDERGYYKQTKHCKIELQFSGVQELEFDYFSYQNVILELRFEENGTLIKGTFSSSVGLEVIVMAEEALVLSLTPTIHSLQTGPRGGAQPLQ